MGAVVLSKGAVLPYKGKRPGSRADFQGGLFNVLFVHSYIE